MELQAHELEALATFNRLRQERQRLVKPEDLADVDKRLAMLEIELGL